jgi:hypothetical protein
MKSGKRTPISLAAAAAALLVVPATAVAQTSGQDTEVRATVYGYFPHIGGSSVFPGAGSSIDVQVDKLIENTDFAFMGSAEVMKRRIGAFSDVIYMDLGKTKSNTRELRIAGAQLPEGVTANAALDIKAWVWTIAGEVRAVSTPTMTLDFFGGARLLDATATLGWAFSHDIGPFSGPTREGELEAANGVWDGVGGLKGRLALGSSGLFVPFYADAGAGESDLTWQGIAGIGYAFKHAEIIVSYRHLDYDLKTDGVLRDIEFDGPVAGVSFRW